MRVVPTQDDAWVLTRPLVWRDATRRRITVPKGFLTDLASIPRCLRNLPGLDVNGKSRRPAALHDYLYSAGRALIADRQTADQLLRESMRAEGVNFIGAWVFYAGVRIGGRGPWKAGALAPVSLPISHSAALPTRQALLSATADRLVSAPSPAGSDKAACILPATPDQSAPR